MSKLTEVVPGRVTLRRYTALETGVIEEIYSELQIEPQCFLVMVNRQRASAETPFAPGDEVLVMPIIGGG
jgi:sulfur carrier protein ThiS